MTDLNPQKVNFIIGVLPILLNSNLHKFSFSEQHGLQAVGTMYWFLVVCYTDMVVFRSATGAQK
jgi:hypothetical protein